MTSNGVSSALGWTRIRESVRFREVSSIKASTSAAMGLHWQPETSNAHTSNNKVTLNGINIKQSSESESDLLPLDCYFFWQF